MSTTCETASAHTIKVYSRSLPSGFVYPCSSSEVRRLFPDHLVDNVSFDLLPPAAISGKKDVWADFKGRVILRACESYTLPWSELPPYLTIFAVEERTMSEDLHSKVLGALQSTVREWAEHLKSTPRTRSIGRSALYIELREGRLHSRALRCK